MAWLKIEDFARTSLQVAVSDSDTSMTVLDGERLPDEGPMLLTLWDGFGYSSPVEAWEAGELEVVRCTGRTGDVLTVERGDGAAGWDAGTVVALTVNAEVVEEIQDAVDAHTHDGVGHGGLINVGDLTGWDDYDGFTLRGDTIVSRGAANRLDIGTTGAPDNLRVWGELQIGADTGLQRDMPGSLSAAAGTNLWSDAIVEFARVIFADRLIELLGNDLLGLWIPTGRTNDTVPDWSGNERHGSIGQTQQNCVGGLCRSVIAGPAGKSWTLPAAAWQSFGDGTNDSPFTIISLLSPIHNPATNKARVILGKAESRTGGTNEYVLFWTQTYVYFRLYSGGARANYIGRRTAGLPEEQWQVIAATYDGSKAVGGLKILINGARADTTNYSSGTYVAMQPTGAALGQEDIATTTAIDYPDGYMGATALIAGVPDDAELARLTELFKTFGGVS